MRPLLLVLVAAPLTQCFAGVRVRPTSATHRKLSVTPIHPPSTLPHLTMVEPDTKVDWKRGGAKPLVFAFIGFYVVAHVVGVLNAQPANALETALDTANVLDVPASTIPEAGRLQYAALAVTLFSILPTPGMLGIGKDVAVTDNEATKQRKARLAREAKARGGKPKMMAATDDHLARPSRRVLGGALLSMVPITATAATPSATPPAPPRELTPKELGALRIAELRKVVRLPGGGKTGEPTVCEKCFTRSCIARECQGR